MHYFAKSQVLAVERYRGVDVADDIANLDSRHGEAFLR
jgi:hypothetical protein